MNDAAPEHESAAADNRSFHDILKGLVGKPVTVVNPESYEDAPIGHTIKANFYKAKVTGMGTDYITVITEFKGAGKAGGVKPVKQFVPIDRIKRISVLKGECLIHI